MTNSSKKAYLGQICANFIQKIWSTNAKIDWNDKNLIKKELKELLNKKANKKLIKASDTSTISILKTFMKLESFNFNILKERKQWFVEWLSGNF